MNEANPNPALPKAPADLKLDLKYYMFDWDDNILHMPTRIHLERKTPDGWEPYDVSTAEFAKIRRDTENYRPKEGDWDKAFVDFYDIGEKGEDVFLEDAKSALAPVIAGDAKGAPSFESFRQALIEGRLFAIITARSHSSRAIRKGVEYFIRHVLTEDERRQMIRNLRYYVARFDGHEAERSDDEIMENYLSLNRYHGVTSPEFERRMGRKSSGSESPEHAKQVAIKDFVQHVIALIRGGGVRESISIGFSDDDQKNVQAVQEFINEELRKEFPGVKFVVYDTSDPSRPNGHKIVIADHPPAG
ncbi:MAG TPA: hypothetical protein PKE26_15070 [Kiritimatiellia bacterium]|nr:hypothetical protein [Kiritimatiellia bacterium]HMP00418.1 hypothetical protein [Kiritimatiellia bacterium]HMP97872.1 hypothetical protein [Kiritimatiellia bacterium]